MIFYIVVFLSFFDSHLSRQTSRRRCPKMNAIGARFRTESTVPSPGDEFHTPCIFEGRWAGVGPGRFADTERLCRSAPILTSSNREREHKIGNTLDFNTKLNL